MCRTDCAFDNSGIIVIGDVYCPNTKCLGKLCLHKRLSNLPAEAIFNVRNAYLCQVRNIPSKIK